MRMCRNKAESDVIGRRGIGRRSMMRAVFITSWRVSLAKSALSERYAPSICKDLPLDAVQREIRGTPQRQSLADPLISERFMSEHGSDISLVAVL